MTPDVERAASALRRFATRVEPRPGCDLCGVELPDEHAHLYEPEPRRVACACKACSFLFPDGAKGRYRTLRSRAVRVTGLRLDEDDFRAMGIPVRLALLSPSDVHARVIAVYPNSAGATESTVPGDVWTALVGRAPELAVEPDAEGLLIDHLGGRSRCFVASLDVCYRFVGLLRAPGGTRGAALADALAFLDGLDGESHG